MNDDPLFRDLAAPSAPPGLREAALEAGREALAASAREDGTHQDAWARAFRSPVLRLAWAASVLLLVVLHLTFDRSLPGASAPPQGRPEPGLDPELAPIFHLPTIAAQTLPGDSLNG